MATHVTCGNTGAACVPYIECNCYKCMKKRYESWKMDSDWSDSFNEERKSKNSLMIMFHRGDVLYSFNDSTLWNDLFGWLKDVLFYFINKLRKKKG